METSEIIIASGQIGISIILGGMALMYSHRVYKIEKNRDDQVNKDRLAGLILELEKENQEYFMKRLELKDKVVNFVGGSIYSNEIWNLLDSEDFEPHSANFKSQLESKFNEVNTQKYKTIGVKEHDAAQEFLNFHTLHVKKLIIFCQKILLYYKSEEIKALTRNLLITMANKNNPNIEYNSPEQIFYYYIVTGKTVLTTENLIEELTKLLPQES